MKKTIVLGASPNPARYSHLAVARLLEKEYEVVPVGIREGAIAEQEIKVGRPSIEEVHTVSIYLSPQHQEQYLDYILELKPQRVIFNPGSENPPMMDKLEKEGIEVLAACTLVMLSVNNY